YYRNPKTGKMEKSKGLYNRRVQEYQLCIKDLK
ncbi:endolysin, partial [Klebsiella phage vB_Kpn-VAC111]